MGVNEHGVAIGNEAVFTRLPVPKSGRTGMEFVRIALGVSRTADDALDLLIDLTERFPQGGRMGHRHRSFRYNSSFIIADGTSGWVFETAGQLWAARRIRGLATISNALTIEDDFRPHTHRCVRDRAETRLGAIGKRLQLCQGVLRPNDLVSRRSEGALSLYRALTPRHP